MYPQGCGNAGRQTGAERQERFLLFALDANATSDEARGGRGQASLKGSPSFMEVTALPNGSDLLTRRDREKGA